MEEESLAIDQRQLVVGIALSGSRKAKNVVKWAVEKFLPESDVTFKLIHVYPKINVVPAPLGTWLPVSQVREDVLNGYRQEVRWNVQRKLIPHQKKLNAQKIKADIVLLESDDIPMAISMKIARQSIRHLVIGNTSTGIFSMINLSITKEGDKSQVISENAPSFCSVYVIGSDARLQQIRPADSESTVITMDDTSNLSSTTTYSSFNSSSLTTGNFANKKGGRLSKSKTTSSPRYKSSTTAASDCSYTSIQPEAVTLEEEKVEFEPHLFKNTYFDSCNVSVQSHSSSSEDSESWVSYQTYPGGSFAPAYSNSLPFTGTPPLRSSVNTPTGSFLATPPAVSPVGTSPAGSYAGTPPTISRVETPPKGGSYADTPPIVSRIGTVTGGSYVGTHPTYVSTSLAVSHTGTPIGCSPPIVSFPSISSSSGTGASQSQITELEKLRMELKHIGNMRSELSQNSSMDERLNERTQQQPEEASKLKNEKGKELARKMNKLKEVEDDKVMDTEGKTKLKETTDTKAAQEAEEISSKLKGLFASPAAKFQKFTWEEIMEATSSLSDEFKIGMGAFGTVYKCKLHYTTVAIKVLHSVDSVTNKQFVQELEILSSIRHPHLLLLLGAVPEQSCLVYEYMDHGSLDDRLFKKNGKPPLPWYDRFRICYEVAGALAFLHSTTPRPIIHRDLKPANILLDHNLVSKIGDAGLGTMINVEPNNLSLKTIYKETSPVGTLCYIDPEYQRTGRVSTKSDIYALGIVILQLLTAKHAVGVAYVVEDAIDEGTLTEILDPEAGEWPEKETLELALLGLQCAELRGRDRPDLREKILPLLERLTEVANSARESASSTHVATPPHYFCPILKDMMEDPYVAADGYTYERRAIEQWLNENHTSPITKQPLPHKFIMPNTSLLEAIKQWKSKYEKY